MNFASIVDVSLMECALQTYCPLKFFEAFGIWIVKPYDKSVVVFRKRKPILKREGEKKEQRHDREVTYSYRILIWKC